jgi:hypothetical protein
MTMLILLLGAAIGNVLIGFPLGAACGWFAQRYRLQWQTASVVTLALTFIAIVCMTWQRGGEVVSFTLMGAAMCTPLCAPGMIAGAWWVLWRSRRPHAAPTPAECMVQRARLSGGL